VEDVLVVVESSVERVEPEPVDAVAEAEVLDPLVDEVNEPDVLEPERVEDAEPEKLAVLVAEAVAVDEAPVESSELKVVDAVNDPELLDPVRVEDAEPETPVVLDTEAVEVDPPVLVEDELSPLELLKTDCDRVPELPVTEEPELAPVALAEEADDVPVEIWLKVVTTGLPVPVPARGRVMVL
jgi:hypothetical protein